MALTPEQVTFYQTFGFLVHQQAFSPEEMKIIERDFDATMLADRQGQKFDGKQRQSVSDSIEQQPGVQKFMNGDRIAASVEQLLGPGYSFEASDANLYVGDTGWHGDHGWHPSMLKEGDPDLKFIKSRYYPGLKLAFYLDPVARDTGCLRVIPGGHVRPFHDSLRSIYYTLNSELASQIERFGVAPQDLPCHAIESEPGDIVFFSHQMWHASFGGRSGRRMFSFNFKGKGFEGYPA